MRIISFTLNTTKHFSHRRNRGISIECLINILLCFCAKCNPLFCTSTLSSRKIRIQFTRYMMQNKRRKLLDSALIKLSFLLIIFIGRIERYGQIYTFFPLRLCSRYQPRKHVIMIFAQGTYSRNTTPQQKNNLIVCNRQVRILHYKIYYFILPDQKILYHLV